MKPALPLLSLKLILKLLKVYQLLFGIWGRYYNSFPNRLFKDKGFTVWNFSLDLNLRINL
ncbi:MAG: hypothetical protein D6699_03480 [Aquificota bacterium]|nr:MAG: hypothetical protein D6699_03480 [Aquificota bacterium]